MQLLLRVRKLEAWLLSEGFGAWSNARGLRILDFGRQTYAAQPLLNHDQAEEELVIVLPARSMIT